MLSPELSEEVVMNIEADEYEVPLSNEKPIPKWIFWISVTLPFWGIFTFYLYWNGSFGWLDRGYWKQLQVAANTTYPSETEAKAEFHD